MRQRSPWAHSPGAPDQTTVAGTSPMLMIVWGSPGGMSRASAWLELVVALPVVDEDVPLSTEEDLFGHGVPGVDLAPLAGRDDRGAEPEAWRRARTPGNARRPP